MSQVPQLIMNARDFSEMRFESNLSLTGLPTTCGWAKDWLEMETLHRDYLPCTGDEVPHRGRLRTTSPSHLVPKGMSAAPRIHCYSPRFNR
jgi:hypothetical protein